MSSVQRPPDEEHLPLCLRDLGEAVDLFQQVAADRLGLNRTDLGVLSLLDARGPLTPGQLAEATGLTTGAVTGVADRLEKAGYVRREPDPDDRRRVIVTLLRDRLDRILRLHEPLHQALHALDSRLAPAEKRLVAGYIKEAAAAFLSESRRLRGAAAQAAAGPAGDGREVTVALDGATRGWLEFSAGAARVQLRANAPAGSLLAARFDGKPPKVTARDGHVTIAYARFGAFGWGKQGAQVSLSAAVPWELELRGGVAKLDADLRGLDLRSLEIRGGAHAVAVTLPPPTGVVLVRLTGGASDVSFRRPPGTAARLRVAGGAASLVFDSQRLGAVGGTVVLESPGGAEAADRYEIELLGGAAGLEVTAR
ncbi:MAG TPA: MarR family transcriptional regulator [Anaeromyxobacteraceae bacterium]|nr:MarR family transcriptional regulator [Anaeromyxobacteraceae bacterium]